MNQVIIFLSRATADMIFIGHNVGFRLRMDLDRNDPKEKNAPCVDVQYSPCQVPRRMTTIASRIFQTTTLRLPFLLRETAAFDAIINVGDFDGVLTWRAMTHRKRMREWTRKKIVMTDCGTRQLGTKVGIF